MRSPLSNISFCPLDFGNKWFVEGNDFEAPMYWLCEIKGLECFYSARSWNSLGLWYLVTHNFLPKWMNLFSIKPGNTIPRGRAGKIALTDITTGLSPWSTYSNAFGGLWGPNEVFNRKKNMWKNIGTGGLAQGKILGVLPFYTWVVGDLTGQAFNTGSFTLWSGCLGQIWRGRGRGWTFWSCVRKRSRLSDLQNIIPAV